ncbi:hypothetical protein [Aurantimonas sp. VKM B-3413]|uniref:hypothetical protein n=1 Tax=Aurantimonas sp. VKM B-3413 TaxID=2779401 RepID=UPI001E31DD05|nr:hypothetical protein [Aurantimonas sp. VKM B-3413]MCB8839826.1 hypothetical protein [Aurantimonas sp. VKM B-3413]
MLEDVHPALRHVRLEPVLDTGQLSDHHSDYDLIVPLAADGRLDADGLASEANAGRVRRFEEGLTDAVGRFQRKADGHWVFHYDQHQDDDDELGFEVATERFVPGEIVSVVHHGRGHSYRVAFVRPLD